MTRGRSPALWLALAGALAIVGGAALWLQRGALLPQREPDPCASSIVLVADDGRRLDVRSRRCDARHGRHPAVLVAAGSRSSAVRWSRSLSRFARDGGTVWTMALAPPEERAARDVRAAVEALAGEPWTDPGRIGVVLAADAAVEDAADATALASALVVHRPDGPGAAPAGGAGVSVLVVEERDAARAGEAAEAFLAAELRAGGG